MYNMPYQYMPDPNIMNMNYNNKIINLEQQVSKLEREVRRLEHRVRLLENNKLPSISSTKDNNSMDSNDMYMM